MLFHDVLNAAFYAEIGPYDCNPFLRIRLTSKFEVLRFVSIFSGMGASKLRTSAGGQAFGSISAIVVALDHEQRHVVQTDFEEGGLSESEQEAKVDSRLLWYGVID